MTSGLSTSNHTTPGGTGSRQGRVSIPVPSTTTCRRRESLRAWRMASSKYFARMAIRPSIPFLAGAPSRRLSSVALPRSRARSIACCPAKTSARGSSNSLSGRVFSRARCAAIIREEKLTTSLSPEYFLLFLHATSHRPAQATEAAAMAAPTADSVTHRRVNGTRRAITESPWCLDACNELWWPFQGGQHLYRHRKCVTI
mmetsp:Transcript_22065/g.61235  ORF Transcript_22065/g.61235 Transcript_22065/m.61235 type:complete len:200 (+) Transcript_22065:653-1252(+)